jgi:hypothetical protein
MASLATLAGDEQLLQFADNPKVASVAGLRPTVSCASTAWPM